MYYLNFAPKLGLIAENPRSVGKSFSPGLRDRVKSSQDFTFGHPLPKGAREFSFCLTLPSPLFCSGTWLTGVIER